MPNEWNDWNVSVLAKLRRLWLAKNPDGTPVHSTAEIALILGVSKNAAVGKAHRMDLPARPSPIRGGRRPVPEEDRPRPVERRKVTLPPMPSVESVPELAEDPIPPLPPPPQPKPGRIAACCWPIGEPGQKSFRFCDEPSEPGKPYCPDHTRLAYVRVRDRREDAA